MLYAKIENGAVVRFPVTATDIVLENRKHTSFPEGVLSAATMAEFGCIPVTVAPEPGYDRITQALQRVTPTLSAGMWTQAWTVTETYPLAADKTAAIAANLVTVKADLSKQIDDAALATYYRPAILSKEYEAREAAATAYKAAGYTGTVPPRLAGFATPKGMTPTAAANFILTQATQQRSLMDTLSDLRMRKYEVQGATTDTAARAAHTAVMAQIAVIAAGLG